MAHARLAVTRARRHLPREPPHHHHLPLQSRSRTWDQGHRCGRSRARSRPRTRAPSLSSTHRHDPARPSPTPPTNAPSLTHPAQKAPERRRQRDAKDRRPRGLSRLPARPYTASPEGPRPPSVAAGYGLVVRVPAFNLHGDSTGAAPTFVGGRCLPHELSKSGGVPWCPFSYFESGPRARFTEACEPRAVRRGLAAL